MSASIIPYERNTLHEQRKVYWARRSSSNHLGGSIGFHWQVSHGIHPGNKSRDHSGVLCGVARNFVGHLRRRNLGRVAVRFTEAACGQAGGVQSAKKCSAQRRKQK